MSSFEKMVEDFLRIKTIAIVGISGKDGGNPGNHIYRKLKNSGYSIFGVNPTCTEIDGELCYPTLSAVPEVIEGVVIVTNPTITQAIVEECVQLDIKYIWMHQLLKSASSVSQKAVAFAQENGITVIADACPLMYCPPVDPVHTCFRWFFKVSGRLR